jgi:tRNA threonylcarbamoyladenosine biosynthesis protein TsaB
MSHETKVLLQPLPIDLPFLRSWLRSALGQPALVFPVALKIRLTDNRARWRRLLALCHSERNMTVGAVQAMAGSNSEGLVLGVDTCGPAGSVALGRLVPDGVEVMDLRELAGRTYSAMLVTSVEELLSGAKTNLNQLAAIVAVHGPGSFTGVRVGLSAVKGLAEPAQIPIIALSRLAVLSFKAGVDAAALDAQRSELFLRLSTGDGNVREFLAGTAELASVGQPPPVLAICDESAALLVEGAWPATRLLRVEAPTAVDALVVGRASILRREFTDPERLDGHYLRRSDAEIFAPVHSPSSAERS